MRPIFILVKKDFAIFLRNHTAVFLTFFVPVALIYIFGQVFGLNRKNSGPVGIHIAVVNQSENPAASILVDAIKAEKSFSVITHRTDPGKSPRPLTQDDLRPMMRANEFRFAVVLPKDFITGDSIGLHLKILSDPRNEIEMQAVNGLLQKTIFSNVPRLLGQSLQRRAEDSLGSDGLKQFSDVIAGAISSAFGVDAEKIQSAIESGNFDLSQLDEFIGADSTPVPPGSPEKKDGDFFSRIVKIDNEQVIGREVKSPDATRIVGGWAVMFLLFALSATSAAFFDEKKAGLFQRLFSAPIHRSQILWSRFLFGVLLGLVQLTALFFAGHFLYGIDVLGHLGNLLLICAAAAAACTGFGMLLAAITRTQQAANGLATFLVLMMSACGGAWFPVSFMPEFMQHFAKFTLVYWAMEGFSQVLWAGNTFLEILPTVGILLAIAASVMTVAIWRFKHTRIFD